MKKEIEQRLNEVKKMFDLMALESHQDIGDFLSGVNEEFEKLEKTQEKKMRLPNGGIPYPDRHEPSGLADSLNKVIYGDDYKHFTK